MSDAHKRNLRLPQELAGRLKKEAAAQGISENDYLIIAATAKLDADEARRRQQAATAPVPRRGRERDAPRGLGLRLESLAPEAPAATPEPAAPVVVNVGAPGTGAAGADLVPGLAAHITAGPVFERQRRRQHALDIIKDACPTPAARREATQKLEALLAARTDPPRFSPSIAGTGQIGRLFRP